jgi:hypothetical protein
MRRSLLAVLSLAVAGSAWADLAPGPRTPPPKPQARVCQKYQGCGPTTELPECTPELAAAKAMPVGDVYKQRTTLKGKLTIKGALSGAAACTQMACSGGNACCNRCGGDVILAELETRSQVRISLVDAAGVRLATTGDDSLVCSPLTIDGKAPTMQAVIATGELTLDKDEMVLKNPTVCRLATK